MELDRNLFGGVKSSKSVGYIKIIIIIIVAFVYQLEALGAL